MFFEDRLLNVVEFDDALLDLQWWKNPRYDGSKLTAKEINKFNPGDITFGRNPVLEKKTTALYIADTVIGGEDEDEGRREKEERRKDKWERREQKDEIRRWTQMKKSDEEE